MEYFVPGWKSSCFCSNDIVNSSEFLQISVYIMKAPSPLELPCKQYGQVHTSPLDCEVFSNYSLALNQNNCWLIDGIAVYMKGPAWIFHAFQPH